jgi:superfamily II DNA helicase RecQ
MGFRFFTISIHDSGPVAEELNGFLSQHRILAVDRRFVEQGSSSFWCFCVDYLETPSGTGYGGGRSKIDYKEVLQPEQFTVFAKLRDRRKEIAQAEGVPVYTIFTNEQLAQMVQTHAASRAELAKIDGIGEARLEKYGERMLEILNQSRASADEANRKPV